MQPHEPPYSHANSQSADPEKPRYSQTATETAEESSIGLDPDKEEDAKGNISKRPAGPRPLPPTSHSRVSSITRKPVGVQAVNAKFVNPIGPLTECASEPLNNFIQPKSIAQNTVEADPQQWQLAKQQSIADFGDQKAMGQEHSPGGTREIAEVEDFNITLIRRDPTSAGQWNVGSMSFKGLTSSVIVKINNPGYQKYVNGATFQRSEAFQCDPSSSRVEGLDSDLRNNLTEMPAETSSNSVPNSSQLGIFTRKLTISYPKSPQSRARAWSQASRESPEPTKPQHSPSKASQLRGAHFSFLSPWGGACAFSTGLNGRSLKCKHSLPGSTITTTGSASAAVAEIRFNLPWVVNKPAVREGVVGLRGGEAYDRYAPQPSRPTLANTLGQADPRSSASNVAKAAFRHSWQKIKDRSLNRESSEDNAIQEPGTQSLPPALPPRPSNPGVYGQQGLSSPSQEVVQSEKAFEEAVMDLTLGREKAGGGFKGKSAKLGKLVLEDEGLKMCDLSVAMCMAVWWLYYT